VSASRPLCVSGAQPRLQWRLSDSASCPGGKCPNGHGDHEGDNGWNRSAPPIPERAPAFCPSTTATPDPRTFT